MLQMGFSVKWCSLVESMLLATFEVVINECWSKLFCASNGLRQGDPIAPFLFLLVMEAFSKLMEWAINARVIVLLCKGSVSMSHILFADDLMIFSKVSQHLARGIRHT